MFPVVFQKAVTRLHIYKSQVAAPSHVHAHHVAYRYIDGYVGERGYRADGKAGKTELGG